MRDKYPYSELFWSTFSHIRTEYGEKRSISTYLAWILENADQNNSEYGLFLRLSVTEILTYLVPYWTKLKGMYSITD